MGKKKQMSYPPVPRYVPKSKGDCGVSPSGERLGCGKPVYKRPVNYKNMVWHGTCLVKSAKDGKV